MKILVIKVDGSETEHETTMGAWVKDIERLIGARSLDSFGLRDGRRVWVDDLGYETVALKHGSNITELVPVKARKPVNPRATELYHGICRPGTTHQIVGNVAIMWDKDFSVSDEEDEW